MPDARTQILERIRQQLGPQAESPRAYTAIPRLYRQSAQLSGPARITLLLDRLADYDAEIVQLPDEAAIAPAVSAILTHHNESTLLVPPALPSAWLPPNLHILRDADAPDQALTQAQLTTAPAVLTPCSAAIAETGSILLEHGPAQGRRVLTLLPDHHLCVLRTHQIVETVSEAFSLLDPVKHAPITTISGPSATADIEMTRIRGVHGPRRLTVLLIA